MSSQRTPSHAFSSRRSGGYNRRPVNRIDRSNVAQGQSIPSHEMADMRAIFMHSKDGCQDPSYLQHTYLNQGVEQGNSREGWSQVETHLSKLDNKRIRSIKEDMDTLLVFAGLFSAVLTAFNIESYKGLQQDPDVLSAKLLFNLTQSIHNLGFIIQGNIVNSTQSVIIPSPTFETPATYVRINILWFTSLVFSLVTAALAMLVKQWLGQFPPIEWATAQERVRARNFRHRGLIKWGVMDVATALPVFLQIALLLFLLGLSEFTRNLHPTVGWTITGLIVLWFCALLTSILAPILSARCPYKTPLLKRPLSLIRGWVFSFINAVKRETSEEVTQLLVEEEHIVEDSSQDISILVTLDDYFRNLDFLRAVQSCLSDADLDTVLQWVGGMVANRTKGDINHENLGEEICEFALYPLTKPALRLTIQTIFDASKREFNHCLRHNSQCLEDGLPCNLKTTLKLILRVALFADELVRSPSRFGAFIVELLAQNANVRKDLIDTVLSRDWFFPPSDPWITDVSLMTDVIDSVTEIITPPTQADTISPDPNTDIVQTTCAILNLTLHTKLEILTELTTNLTTLFKSLAESIQIQYPIPNTQQITNKTPQLNCAKTCIHICHLLNEKIPTPDPSEKFICQELIDTLSGIAASTRH